MMRRNVIVFQKTILLFWLTTSMISCCKSTIKLDNGLTKSASSIIEYTIQVASDSNGIPQLDTLVCTTKTYNTFNNITSRQQYNIFSDDSININFIYNQEQDLIKEQVNLSETKDVFEVVYHYEKSKLKRSSANFEFSSLQSQLEGTYNYTLFGDLKTTTQSQLFINKEDGDTLTHNLEKSYYKNDLVYKSEFQNFKAPEKNSITEYIYKCDTLTQQLTYNFKDSLLSRTEYKYEYDAYGNWISKQSFSKGQLTLIKTRKINYRH